MAESSGNSAGNFRTMNVHRVLCTGVRWADEISTPRGREPEKTRTREPGIQ